MESTQQKRQAEKLDFASQASTKQTGFMIELWLFLRSNKEWWLTPMILILVLFGMLVILGGTATAPFIYTLF
jgi:drug/metabolite transporter superfamily protein YnfA